VNNGVKMPDTVVSGIQRRQALSVQRGEFTMNQTDLLGIRSLRQSSLFAKPLAKIFEIAGHYLSPCGGYEKVSTCDALLVRP